MLSAPAAAADNLTGQASIVDGDMLEIHGTRIRLWGMDAPESSQLCGGEDSLQYRCGAKAATDLDALIAGRSVSCIPISLDQYGRTVASCSVGGVDLGEWLVRNGLALNWPQYSKGKLDAIQREAKHAGRVSGRLFAMGVLRTLASLKLCQSKSPEPQNDTSAPFLERNLPTGGGPN